MYNLINKYGLLKNERLNVKELVPQNMLLIIETVIDTGEKAIITVSNKSMTTLTLYGILLNSPKI